jgi:uncharacterized protein (DUF1778 family)
MKSGNQLRIQMPMSAKNTIRQAAATLGTTPARFVVQAALDQAQRVIEQERVIRLSTADARFLCDLLDNPPPPNARLRKALADYRERARDPEHSSFDFTLRPAR